MTYIIALIALPLLCVLWIVFQQWLAAQDPKYRGYQAGCGGCSRSCGKKESGQTSGVEKTHFVDASALWSKYSK